MAGVKFLGDFMERFGKEFATASQGMKFGLDIDTKGLETARDTIGDMTRNLSALGKKAAATNKAITYFRAKIEEAGNDVNKVALLQERLTAVHQKNNSIIAKQDKAQRKLAAATQAFEETKRGETKKTVDNFKKASTSMSGAVTDYNKEQNELIERFKGSAESSRELGDSLDASKMKMAAGIFSGLSSNFEASFDEIGDMVGNMTGGIIGNMITQISPLGGFIGQVLGDVIQKVWLQLKGLNDILTKLQRATGGLATATSLGYDQFGNAKNGMDSLATSALKANISTEEFKDAITNLYSTKGFGQIKGMKQDLKSSQSQMQAFGIESARLAKLYGMEIGPTVGGMMMDFGMDMKESTGLLREGADTARVLGLNVQQFGENLKQATNLAGKLYFRTNEELVRMAGLASQLGTNVDSIAGGIIEMKGILGLFEQQQKTVALGMNNVGKNLAAVYALRVGGKQEEASQLELTSMAKDIQQQGFQDQSGAITTQGIQTLTASGLDQEQIKVIQRMGRSAHEAGIALDRAFDPSKLTMQEQFKLQLAEDANMTIIEQGKMIFGRFSQAIIDPLAKIIGPIIQFLMNFGTALSKGFVVFSSVINLLTGWIQYIFQLDKLFEGIMFPLQFIGFLFDQLSKFLNSLLPKVDKVGKGMEAYGEVVRVLGIILGTYLTFQVAKFALEKAMGTLQIIAWGASIAMTWLNTTALGFLGVSTWGAALAMMALSLPIWLVIAAIVLLAVGIVYWWDEICKAFKTAYDWIMGLFGDDEETSVSGSAVTADDWKSILGAQTEAGTPSGAAPTLATGSVAESQSGSQTIITGSEQQKANEKGINNSFNPTPVTNNITVSGLFNNKASLKKGG